MSSFTVTFKTNRYCFFTQILGTAIYKKYISYLFSLVSLTVFTCRKETRTKKKQFPLDKKSLYTSGNKIFSKKLVSTKFSDDFDLKKKRLNMRKRLPLDRNNTQKSVLIQNFFQSVFSCIQSEYRKIQTRKGIKLLLNKLPPPNFKNFNKALKESILLPLDKKFVSTRENEQFVSKIRFH